MKVGTKLMLFFLVIAISIFITFKFSLGPKQVDISKVETMDKPSGVSDIKVESEGNVRKVTIIADDGPDKAKESAEKLYKDIKKEDGVVFMVVVLDGEGKHLLSGLATIGAETIDWN